MVALLGFYSLEVIAIAAPLSLPLELCCLEESYACEPKFARKCRRCDQELRRQGIPCYPTSKKTFIKDLIYRGIALKTSIAHELRQASQVIEVYSFASKVRLSGMTMPRKTTKQGMNFLKDKLAADLPGLEPYLAMFDHDLGDAAMAAYTGLLYHRNKVDALGNGKEGPIFVPD